MRALSIGQSVAIFRVAIPNYMSDMIYDTCSQHAIWQYILRDQDAFKALAASLTALAQPLYAPMFDALDGLED